MNVPLEHLVFQFRVESLGFSVLACRFGVSSLSPGRSACNQGFKALAAETSNHKHPARIRNSCPHGVKLSVFRLRNK